MYSSFLFLLSLIVLLLPSSTCQDAFINRTCSDSFRIGTINLGQFCLIYGIQGCSNAVLNVHITRDIGSSSTELYSTQLSNGTSYPYSTSFGSATCSFDLRILPSPWVLTPTFAVFSVAGVIQCTVPIIGTLSQNIDQPNIQIGEDCSVYNDCVGCLQSGRCGWCQSGAGGGLTDKKCTAERKDETQPYCASCSQWIYNAVEQCPGYVPTTPPPTTTPTTTSGGSGSSTTGTNEAAGKDNTGKAVGIAVGVGVGIVGLGAIGVCFYMKRRPKYHRQTGGGDGVEMRDGEAPMMDDTPGYAPPTRMASSSIANSL